MNSKKRKRPSDRASPPPSSHNTSCSPKHAFPRTEQPGIEELLPDELLCHIFKLLPECFLPAAARTCRRWYDCCPPEGRNACTTETACSSPAMLEWSLQSGYEITLHTIACAAGQGDLPLLQRIHGLLQEEGQGSPWSSWACSNAAKGGHLHVLQWLREQGCSWDHTTCNQAALKGHLEVLRWAREQGCPWGESTCCRAAMGGHLEVLQWLRAEGCPWDETTCHMAASQGHLKVLRWARQQGCPWDEMTCANAVRGGQSHLLEWLRENGCPSDS
ncbi:Ankyrin repeat-containing domain [Balamuthia mandrillaris]